MTLGKIDKKKARRIINKIRARLGPNTRISTMGMEEFFDSIIGGCLKRHPNEKIDVWRAYGAYANWDIDGTDDELKQFVKK